MYLMSLYQKHYPFIGIVFTKSDAIRQLADEYSLTVISEVQRNVYGLPILKDLIISMKMIVHSEYYGYINSDILVSPRIFELLQVVSILIHENKLYENTELVSRANILSDLLSLDYLNSMKQVNKTFNKYSNNQLRSIYGYVELLYK